MKAEELVSQVSSLASSEKTVFFNEAGEVHNRDLTTGASETFSCLRKLAYSKQGAEINRDWEEEWGFYARGNVIEDWLAQRIHKVIEKMTGYQFTLWGGDQQTLVEGTLSATPDGLLSVPEGKYIAVEIKSIDPRYKGQLPKKEHVYQTQIQMGLLQKKYNCRDAIIIYVEASCFSNMKCYDIAFDENLYLRAHERSQLAFNQNPSSLPAEGKYLGDCNYCQYTDICSEHILRDMPTGEKNIADELAGKLDTLLERKVNLDTVQRVAKFDLGVVTEQIKQVLRDQNLQSASTGVYEASYSLNAGRKRLDKEAVEDAGIDLEEFYIQGKPSDTLRVKKIKSKETL